MTGGDFTIADCDCFVTRSGYTGEDGFEISVPAAQAETLARALLAQPRSSRLAWAHATRCAWRPGQCLYGNDIDTTTTPVEAALNWAIQKCAARAAHGPVGSRVPTRCWHNWTTRGPHTQTRRPGRHRARAGARTCSAGKHGRLPAHRPGHQRSAEPHAQSTHCHGLRRPGLRRTRDRTFAMVRGKPVPMKVSATPFVPTCYYRG